MLDVQELRGEILARGARVVAIDGRGGAGKSTLARLLADGWPAAVVVGMDDFYRPVAERARAPETHGASLDLERLRREVLDPLASGLPARYQRYDWDQDRLAEWHEVPAGAVVLLEGVYSASEMLCGHLDFTIWVECPHQERLRRAIARDGESMRSVWTGEWMPAEDRYVHAQRPDRRADVVLDGSGEDVAGVGFQVRARRRRR